MRQIEKLIADYQRYTLNSFMQIIFTINFLAQNFKSGKP